MGILERIGTILRANLNELLSRAEDPETILNQTLMDMRQAQYEARMEVARAIAEGKRLERDLGRQDEAAEGWLGRAERALGDGREDLAREALRRKRASGDLAAGLREQLELHLASVERLKVQLRALDAKIEEAERKRQVLLARQRRAEAQRSIRGALGRADTTTAEEAFDRMEDRVLQLEDRLEAEEELERELSLEEEFEALEAEPEIEDELARLKARLQGEGGA